MLLKRVQHLADFTGKLNRSELGGDVLRAWPLDLTSGAEGASIENEDTTGYQAEAALEFTRGGAWQAQLGYRAIVIVSRSSN